MKELIKPKNFKQNMSFKMSNMNMSVKIENNKIIKAIPFSYWIDPKNLKNYIKNERIFIFINSEKVFHGIVCTLSYYFLTYSFIGKHDFGV